MTPYDKLFTPKGHRLTTGTRKEAHAVELHPNDMFLRCERQVLFRLPQSGAIVFCVRQYIYAVKDLKEDVDKLNANIGWLVKIIIGAVVVALLGLVIVKGGIAPR